MANNPNIILGAGQGRPESVDYNSARNIVQAGAALQSKQEQQDLQRSMQAQSAFQSALQQSGGDYDKAISQSEQQGYDMTPVRAARAKLQGEIYKAGQEQLNQHKTEDDLIGRVFNTMDASDPVSIQTGTQMLMRIDPRGGWDQIVGQNPTKEHLAQLGGLGMTAKEHADLAAKSLESMKAGDWLGYLAAGKKSSNSPEDWQHVTALGQRLGIAPEIISHVEQMTPDQLDEVLKVKPTKEMAAKVGSFEDYVTRTYGENPTPAQILAARKAYGQADDRAPQVHVSVAGPAGGKSDVQETVAGWADGTLPPVISGRASKDYNALMAEAHRQKFDLAKANQDWTATQKYLGTLNGAQQTRLRQATEQVSETVPLVRALVTEWDSAGIPYLSAANLAAAKKGAYGNKAQSLANRLDAQIADMTSELGTVYKGGNSSTDESLKLAARNLQGDWSRKAALDALDQIEQNIKYRRNSMKLGPVSDSNNRYAPNLGGPDSSVGPKLGERRNFSGKIGEWDGKGWKAVQ